VVSVAEVNAIAELLDEAARRRTPTPQLAARGHQLSVPEAYAVQAELIRRRERRGEQLVGIKMGFTSEAKRTQMGIADLIWGRLTDAMCLRSGARTSLADYIHPRIEPEVAFRLGRPLQGAVSRAEAAAAVEAVAPALEIIDSRYRDFRFSLADVIADNSSSAAVVVGEWRALPEELARLSIVMSFDGRAVQSGSTAAIMGDPLLSLVAAARLAGEAGLTLAPGWLVMAGGATAAESLAAPVQVSAEVEALGRVQIEVRA
jgi:2-oxo-3-hexenedioate decarboxylase